MSYCILTVDDEKDMRKRRFILDHRQGLTPLDGIQLQPGDTGN